MRIVAGQARGRTLQAPEGAATRPTSDRVREAMFSMVISLEGIDGAVVVDLFAGSGALGLEAVSRGASAVTFVELDRRAVDVIRSNAVRLGLDGPHVRLIAGDALAHARALGDADVVFADPPYAFDEWAELASALAQGGFSGVAVFESGEEIDLGAGWDAIRVRRYGGTVVTVAQRTSNG